jgi:hypothetical protein
MTVMLYLVRTIPGGKGSVRLRCRDATVSSFVAKVRGEIFAHFHAVTSNMLN